MIKEHLKIDMGKKKNHSESYSCRPYKERKKDRARPKIGKRES